MPYGLPQISGMVVEFDPDAEPGRKVQRVLIQDEPVNPEQVYRLAHTDAEVSNGLGYLVLPKEQKVNYEVPTILREVLKDYLAQHSPLPMVSMGRWQKIYSSASAFSSQNSPILA
jgi:hypothetical protein